MKSQNSTSTKKEQATDIDGRKPKHEVNRFILYFETQHFIKHYREAIINL
jgi:hypothetical protein